MTTKRPSALFVNAIILFTFFLTSCAMDGNNSITPTHPSKPSQTAPNEAVLKSFDMKYPNAKNIQWSTSSNYYVADFTEYSTPVNAWFDLDGNWSLSKSTVAFNSMNGAVTKAFSESSYSDYNVNATSLLERKDMGNIYVMELDNNTNLYFSMQGDMIKTVQNNGVYTDKPVVIPTEVNGLITSLFNRSQIIDLWNDSLGSKVGVITDDTYKVVALDFDYGWIATLWSIAEQAVPNTVLSKFRSSSYGEADVDDIKIMENSEDLAYLFYFDEGDKHEIATVKESVNYISVLSY